MAIFATVALEAILLLMLLTLGQAASKKPVPMTQIDSFDVQDTDDDTPDEPDLPAEKPDTSAPPQFAAAPPPPRPVPDAPTPAPPMPALIPISPDQMRSADISRPKTPPAPSPKTAYGPPDTGSPGDSQRLSGSGPNGEPLYAASWYREPTDSQLAGYLSTASGPGWALINCQTAPEYRVEHCVLVAEQPRGSHIGRSVLAAAWQFRVRPPRIGGRPQVGEWVRIRIDYTLYR